MVAKQLMFYTAVAAVLTLAALHYLHDGRFPNTQTRAVTLDQRVSRAPIQPDAILWEPDRHQRAVHPMDPPRAAPAPRLVPPESAGHDILGCAATARASAQPGAMILLDMLAPCHGGQVVRIHQNGLVFASVLDASGKLTRRIPALSGRAVLIVALWDGIGATAAVTVPDFERFDRAVLQWSGPGAARLRVENAPETARESIRLGDGVLADPQRIEIVTSKPGTFLNGGQAMLQIEAEVTAQTCERDLMLQTLVVRSGNSTDLGDVTLSMPSCSAVGQRLILPFPTGTLRLAAR